MNAWLTLIAALAFGLAPFVTDGFAGFRPEQFPIPQDDAPIQPAGFAFSIWSVIYLWLLLFAVNGVLRHRDDLDWEPVWMPMTLSMGMGAAWIKVATLSVVWATVLIWAMLLTALWAMFAARDIAPKWSAALPIGLYAGWLTAASLVSIGLVGAGYGLWLSQVQWAGAMLVVAFALGSSLSRAAHQVWTYPAALCWAATGIVVANLNGETTVVWLAGGVAVVFAALSLLHASTRS